MELSTMPTDVELAARVRTALERWHQSGVLGRLTSQDPGPSSLLLWSQLLRFELWYPGGLDGYLATAHELLHRQLPDGNDPASSKVETDTDDTDVVATWTPSIPGDPHGLLTLDAPAYRRLESLGLAHADEMAVVIVAGGLGERLGFDGIKLALPVETLTGGSYLETYIRHLQGLEAEIALRREASAKNDDGQPSPRPSIPLAIMTSEATHDATVALLEANGWFGKSPTEITLLRQDVVPCLDLVTTGRVSALALVVDDTDVGSTLRMKPHGHGDVHTLLYTSGLARRWFTAHGRRFVHFIQDTNALILHSLLPLLGAAVEGAWVWGFTTVPRKAKDASGAIVRFDAGPAVADAAVLLNVEYHELDAFLRQRAAAAFPDGDVNDPHTGHSPFPGNINHVVVQLAPYLEVLEATGGRTLEILNPKYRDTAKMAFKSPARLECMLQDLPRLFVTHLPDALCSGSSSGKIGLLRFPAELVYSPCKNDVTSAAAKAAEGIPPQCASSAEHDFFAINAVRLAQLGVKFEASTVPTSWPREWLGIRVLEGPQIAWSGGFAVTTQALMRRFPMPTDVRISRRSTLILQGRDITISSLTLDGGLRIVACDGAKVEIRGLHVRNAGVEYVPSGIDAGPIISMRGYAFNTQHIRTIRFTEPGDYVVSDVQDER